ncbi:10289_t:CDS:2, partial [Gigaspora margarita]
MNGTWKDNSKRRLLGNVNSTFTLWGSWRRTWWLDSFVNVPGALEFGK